METQIILANKTSNLVGVVFEKPLNVAGKRIGFKLLQHTRLYAKDYNLTFTVKDVFDRYHTLDIGNEHHSNSTGVITSMQNAIFKLHLKLFGTQNTQYRTPSVDRAYNRDGSTHRHIISFTNTGLRITGNYNPITGTESDLASSNDVFQLLDLSKVNLNEQELVIELHKLKTKDPKPITQATLHCNIISPSYINNRKEQVLTTMVMDSKDKISTIVDNTPTYHDIIYDEIMYILKTENFYYLCLCDTVE